MKKRFSPWALPLLAVALMGGILIGRQCSSILPCIPPLVLALLALLLGGRRGAVCLLLTGVSLGMVLGQLAWHPQLPPEGMVRVEGVVRDEVETRSTGQVRTALANVTVNGEPLTGYAYWSFYADKAPEGLVPGASVSFTARLYHPSSAANPGDFDFREYLLQHNTRVGLYGCLDLTAGELSMSYEGFTARLRHGLYT